MDIEDDEEDTMQVRFESMIISKGWFSIFRVVFRVAHQMLLQQVHYPIQSQDNLYKRPQLIQCAAAVETGSLASEVFFLYLWKFINLEQIDLPDFSSVLHPHCALDILRQILFRLLCAMHYRLLISRSYCSLTQGVKICLACPVKISYLIPNTSIRCTCSPRGWVLLKERQMGRQDWGFLIQMPMFPFG